MGAEPFSDSHERARRHIFCMIRKVSVEIREGLSEWSRMLGEKLFAKVNDSEGTFRKWEAQWLFSHVEIF
jgi:hypothetical protein